MTTPQFEAAQPPEIEYEIQLSANRSAVWVHASDGSTVGRFGRMGIDLHNTVTDMMAGAPECRLARMESRQSLTGSYSGRRFWSGTQWMYQSTRSM